MQEDTKDLLAITILITFGLIAILFMLWADAAFFGLCLAMVATFVSILWALNRVSDL